MKLKLELLKNKAIYIGYCILILAVSYFLDRFLQMLIFIIFFNFIQSCFKERLHAEYLIEDSYIKAHRLCKIITAAVEIIYMIFCKELNISVYSHLFLILIVATMNCLIGYVVQDLTYQRLAYCDFKYLTSACEKAGLSYQTTQRLVKRYIDHMSIKEIAQEECVEEQAIKMTINRAKKKIEKYFKKVD